MLDLIYNRSLAFTQIVPDILIDKLPIIAKGVEYAVIMDVHKGVDGLTAEAVADAHKKDLETQGKYGVKYLKYWFNEER